MRRLSFLAAAMALFPLNSCVNVFDPIDSPDGDAQLLSAARAAFDKGELAEARRLYGQLPGNETAIAETALVTLDELDLGIGVLATAVSRGANTTGDILTNLVEAAAKKASATTRERLTESYRTIAQISTPELRGFVRFVTSMTLAAEMIAENSAITSDLTFNKSDVVTTGSVCVQNGGGGGCTLEAACAAAATDLADSDGATDDATFVSNPAAASTSGPATWQKVLLALQAADKGLEEMAITSGSSFTLVAQIADAGITPAVAPRCFRYLIIGLAGAGR